MWFGLFILEECFERFECFDSGMLLAIEEGLKSTTVKKHL